MLLATALLIPVILGMSAIAVDIGSYADDKRDLQNDADAIALAAAMDLCKVNSSNCSDTTAAAAAASAYASKNNINSNQITLTYTGLTPVGGVFTSSPTVHVSLARNHDFAFARIFGVDNKDVSANASAAKVSPGGVTGLLPFGVTQDTIDATNAGDLMTIHSGGGGGTTGNYGGMAYDGTGGSVMEDTIRHGALGSVCAAGAAGCTPTADMCSADQCYTEPGVKNGPIGSAIDDRLARTTTSCDTFGEVFTAATSLLEPGADPTGPLAYEQAAGRLFSPAFVPHTPTNTATITATATTTTTPLPTATATITPVPTNTPVGPSATPTNTVQPTSTASSGNTGKYVINPNCNPWTGPGACPQPDNGTTVCSRRVIVIPIIDHIPNGRSEMVTILGFALIYLEDNNGADVIGRFVRADVNFGAISGVYNPNSTVHFVKLVE